jgi:hypothetical protein
MCLSKEYLRCHAPPLLFYFYFFVCPGLQVEDGFIVLAFGVKEEINRCRGLTLMAGFLVFSCFILLYFDYPCLRSSLHEAYMFLKYNSTWINRSLKSFL